MLKKKTVKLVIDSNIPNINREFWNHQHPHITV